MKAAAAVGLALLAAGMPPAASAEPLVAEVYLLGPLPERVRMLERLPARRAIVMVTTGINSSGKELTHAVDVSGGVRADELPRILRAVYVNELRWHPSQPWQIRVHGNDQLVRVSFLYPNSPRECGKHWLLAHTHSSWMRLDPMNPGLPGCVPFPPEISYP